MKSQSVTLLRCLMRRPMTTGAIRAACGISSVGSVIYDLREHGVEIKTELIPARTRHGKAAVARYHLGHKAATKARRLLREAA